ncbi:MAG: hypothetical protein GYB68_12590 [Chloroflexi bacterium]|nr:hypothetical protein [Chloroflexota bacterium]
MFSMLPPPQRIFIIAMLVAWLVLYIVGMIAGTPNEDRSRRFLRSAKIAMVIITVVLGIFWLVYTWADPSTNRFAVWIMAGLAACGIADVVLADIFPIAEPLIPAMVLFGLGHIFYIVGLFNLRPILGATSTFLLAAVVVLSVIAGVLLWQRTIYNPKGSQRLNYGTLIYGIFLLVAAGMAVAIVIETGQLIILALGLLLFAGSDLMLARYLVRREQLVPYVRDVVWIIYSGGQVLIAFSIGAALLV